MTTLGEEFYQLLTSSGQPHDKKSRTKLQKLLKDDDDDEVDLFYTDFFGMTTLHMAVTFDFQDGFKVLVDKLLKHHPDVLDLKNSIGYTALHEAAQGDALDHARILVARGSNVNVTTAPQQDDLETPLHLAARFDSVRCLGLLLENKARVDDTNNLRETALHIAAGQGHAECVRLLLQHGADRKLQDQNSFTAFHVAASVGNREVVKVLCEDQASIPTEKTERGWNWLHLAAYNNHHGVIEELISRCDNKNDRNEKGETALHLAAKFKTDRVDSVKLLLSHKVYVDAKDHGGHTPLHVAIQRGNVACVHELLNDDADRDKTTRDGSSPLHLAMMFQDLSLAPSKQAATRDTLIQKLLLKRAKITKDREQRTPLHLAARLDNPQVIMDLLNRGADINAQDKEGMTPLHTAAIFGKQVFIQSLLDKGLSESRAESGKKIEVDAMDMFGRTALYIAVALKDTECAEALLARGADATCRNKHGVSPLHKAAYVADEFLMDELLKSRPGDLEGEDQEGWRALHVAAMQGAHKCAELLLEAGAKVDSVQPGSGLTSLHMTALRGHLDVLQVLLKYKADVAAVTTDGDTAATLAEENGHVECVVVLQGGGGTGAEMGSGRLRNLSSTCSEFGQGSDSAISTDSVCFKPPSYETTQEPRPRPEEETVQSGEETTASTAQVGREFNAGASPHGVNPPVTPPTPEVEDICERRLQLDKTRIKKTDALGNSCLHKEAELNHAEHLLALVEKGADPRRMNNVNRTPLHVAASVGGAECVEALLSLQGVGLEPKDMTNSTPLHLAASSGHENCVEIILDKAGKAAKILQTKNKSGENALHLATKWGHNKCLEMIFSKLDASETTTLVDTVTDYKSTALHLAAENNRVECLGVLLAHGADVRRTNHKRLNVFEVSVEKNNVRCLSRLLPSIEDNRERVLSDLTFVAVRSDAYECLRTLVDNGADASYRNERNMTASQVAMDRRHLECVRLLTGVSSERQRVEMLHYAAKHGYAEGVRVMAESGTDVDEPDDEQMTALQMAAGQGHVGCVETLIGKGADVNVKDANGLSALSHASRDGHASCVRALVHHSAYVNTADAKEATPIHFAAREERYECLQVLLEAGAAVNSKTKDLWTALHYAAKYGHLECVKLLVDYRVDYNCATSFDYTALRFATGNDHCDIVEYLVALPAIEIDTRDCSNRCALHVATREGRYECVRILLGGGANVNMQDGQNQTALNLAVRFKYKDIAALLLEKGANVDNIDGKGFTPLLSASAFNSVDIMELLVKNRADVNHDANGKTPLYFAVRNKNLVGVKLLLSAGADKTKLDWNGVSLQDLAKKGCNKEIRRALEGGEAQ